MVGAVTAVNEKGIYLSLNAAGSSDRARVGLPTTLLLLKTLMQAKNAEEAIQVLQSEPTFITDIFVLLDSNSGRLYRIEKSPAVTEVIELKGPSVVTNHLIAPRFTDDEINKMRMRELTTIARSQRAEELLKASVFSNPKSAKNLEPAILKIIRDKNGRHLGNRSAIDALIATHAVVFNSEDQVLFVSQGPALAGPFIGFDLKKSFSEKQPVVVRTLPRELTDLDFKRVHDSNQAMKLFAQHLKNNRCLPARMQLQVAPFKESFNYSEAAGDFASQCERNQEKAKELWQQALARGPAYASEKARIEKKLEKGSP